MSDTTTTLDVDLTGDAEDDTDPLTMALDSASMELGQSLTEYAAYLDGLADGLKHRAQMAREEAEG